MNLKTVKTLMKTKSLIRLITTSKLIEKHLLSREREVRMGLPPRNVTLTSTIKALPLSQQPDN